MMSEKYPRPLQMPSLLLASLFKSGPFIAGIMNYLGG